MRAPSAFVVVAVGLVLLWLAVTGRLEEVWRAAVGAAGGDALGSAASVGGPGTTGGGAGGGGGSGGGRGATGPLGIPLPDVRLPDYGEFLLPSYDRYIPKGSDDYAVIKGSGWTRYFAPVAP